MGIVDWEMSAIFGGCSMLLGWFGWRIAVALQGGKVRFFLSDPIGWKEDPSRFIFGLLWLTLITLLLGSALVMMLFGPVIRLSDAPIENFRYAARIFFLTSILSGWTGVLDGLINERMPGPRGYILKSADAVAFWTTFVVWFVLSALGTPIFMLAILVELT